jgi:proteasome accessory factor A
MQGVDNLLGHQQQIASLLMAAAGSLGMPMAGEFLGNGGRLYVDRGGHPEYATPECGSVSDLVTHETAGDNLVRDLAEILNARQGPQLHVYKNNVDFHGHTYGGHENYLITPCGMDAISRLLPFLVTRQIYAGAGKVMTTHKDGTFGFQISQRADFFDCTYSDRTSEIRGIINIRKREITRSEQSRRLHLIIGDSNMAQYAMGLKIGTTVLMLRLLEEGGLDEDFALVAPAAALKAVSRDLHAKLEMQHRGRCQSYTALDIQSVCLEKALQFYAANPLGPEEARWLSLWAQVLQGLQELRVRMSGMAIESDDADLKRKIDWVLKLWLLDRSRSKGADENQLKKLDLKYHDLNPDAGLYERCLSLDLVDRLIPDSEIAEALLSPPQNTRACLRGMIVRQAFDKNVTVEVENWERIRVRARSSRAGGRHPFNGANRMHSMNICLKDPFIAENSKTMEDLRKFIERWG